MTLHVPTLPSPISESMSDNLADPVLMSAISDTCGTWFTKISNALTALNQAEPKAKGPLSEIEYWKERHANLSALDEQLRKPRVVEIIKVSCYM